MQVHKQITQEMVARAIREVKEMMQQANMLKLLITFHLDTEGRKARKRLEMHSHRGGGSKQEGESRQGY